MKKVKLIEKALSIMLSFLVLGFQVRPALAESKYNSVQTSDRVYDDQHFGRSFSFLVNSEGKTTAANGLEQTSTSKSRIGSMPKGKRSTTKTSRAAARWGRTAPKSSLMMRAS